MDGRWTAFTSIPNGTRVFNHGWDQCVALANLYNEGYVGGPFIPVASAYQWWTNYGSYPGLIANYWPSTAPVPGSIVVSFGGPYDNVNGHIGVVTAVYPNGTFDTMEQNAGYGQYRYVYRYNRSLWGVLGFLVPYNNPATVVPEPIPEPEPEPEEEDDTMKNTGTFYIRKADGVYMYVVSNTVSGYRHEFSSGKKAPLDGGYLKDMALAYDIAGGEWRQTTEAEAYAHRTGLDRVRTGVLK